MRKSLKEKQKSSQMMNAVIFDMDGVISDTQKLHAQVEAELLGRYNIKLTPNEITQQYAGVKTEQYFAELLKSTNANIPELMKEKWGSMEALARKEVEPIPGAIELIQRLDHEKIPLAVASASTLTFISIVLEKLQIRHHFKAITSAEEVKIGKPDPAIFLLAAQRIKMKPTECVVIEDGRNGMIAAKRAGMQCIGLVTNKKENYPADVLVQSLTEVNPERIKNL